MLLLAGCVTVRPVVLAPLALRARPGPSTPRAAPWRAARGGGSDGCVFAKLLLLTGLHTPRASQLARTTLVGVRGLREGRQCATTVSPAALVYRAAPVAVLLRHRCRE